MSKILAIEEVQRATEAAMAQVVEYLRTSKNPTSEEAHQIVDSVLEKHGCESPERHIVASGPASAEPHEKGSGPISRGVPIVIDIYPRSKTTGYFADMSRTVCIGEPSPELQKMYDATLAAQEIAIKMVRPGVNFLEIQEAVEKLFSERGFKTSGTGKEFPFAEGFVHSIGHGVGQILHDAPHVRKGRTTLQEGDIVTIEPGLYYKDIGGVRLEDMLLVIPEGSRNLTQFPKGLLLGA